MYSFFEAKNRKIVRRVLAFACSIAAIWMLIKEWDNTLNGLRILPLLLQHNKGFTFLLIILSILNYTLESLKWKTLLQPVLPAIRLRKSFASVLAGYSTGFFTPNRAGEVIGRLSFFKKENLAALFTIQVSSGFVQMSVSLFAGSISYILLSFLQPFELPFLLERLIPYLFISGAIFSMAYRNPEFILRGITTFFPQRFKIPLIFTNKTNRHAWFFSFLRFMIYSLQLLILLHLFWPGISYLKLFAFSGFYFMVISAVPSFAITEAGVKGATGMTLFSMVFDANAAPFASCALLLWLLNVCFPAFTGILFLFKSEEDGI